MILFKLFTFSGLSDFFGVKLYFICKISDNYTDIKCLLDIKVPTEQVKGAGPLVAYSSGESYGGLVAIPPGFDINGHRGVFKTF